MCLGRDQYSGLDPVVILFAGRVIGRMVLCGVAVTKHQGWLDPSDALEIYFIFENSPRH